MNLLVRISAPLPAIPPSPRTSPVRPADKPPAITRGPAFGTARPPRPLPFDRAFCFPEPIR